ncbi:MAG: FxsA family protein [Pseudomonadota bacterium]
MWIFAALVAVPIVEIALFIELGGLLGLWPTIGLVIITAVLGAALLRAQGISAMARLQRAMAEGGDPRGPIADGAMILIAGLLMLTPGFFTDTVGFLLLLPPVRAAISAYVGPRLAARATMAHASASMGSRSGQGGGPDRGRGGGDGPIDVDYEDLTDAEPKPGASGWSRRPGAENDDA